jgi:hypothetical protein
MATAPTERESHHISPAQEKDQNSNVSIQSTVSMNMHHFHTHKVEKSELKPLEVKPR